MTTSPPALECRGVSAGYAERGIEPRVVVSGVSFELTTGGKLLFVGRSGSGKSTLLRVLNRLAEPLDGVVFHDGHPLSERDPLFLRQRVALVQQKPIVFEGTVRDNLLVRRRGAPAPDDARLDAVLADVGLGPEFLDRGAETLSVGEQQRLCLARALDKEPSVLLLDEPTSSLDPESVGVVADLVLDLAARRSLALVVATHQPELARRIDAPALLFADGTAAAATPDRIAAFFGDA
jgi:putative ABC transport system ATP-binding protein